MTVGCARVQDQEQAAHLGRAALGSPCLDRMDRGQLCVGGLERKLVSGVCWLDLKLF